MIISVKNNIKEEHLKKLIEDCERQNLKVRLAEGNDVYLLSCLGDIEKVNIQGLQAHEDVLDIHLISNKFKQVEKKTRKSLSFKKFGFDFSDDRILMIAGPCSIESEEQIDMIAAALSASATDMIRGGAFKPRTSPYSFQGLGKEGLKYLKQTSLKYQMPVISEIMSAEDLELFEEHVDVLQVGARNMQNYDLLKKLGQAKKPVMLKRGFANTIDEWLLAAEYIIAHGNPYVILCERGIRTFETRTRNTLDLSVIPIIKSLTNLPIVIDPSHATGDYRLIKPMALAAIAAGADGLMIEVHPHPEEALSDGAQSLTLERYYQLLEEAEAVAKAVGKELV